MIAKCSQKIDRIYKSEYNHLERELENFYTFYWSKFTNKPSLKYLRSMISISGVKSFLYVQEDIQYNYIEPILNNRAFSLAYNDKNFFEKYLSNYKDYFPETILRSINGCLLDKDYNYIEYEQGIEIMKKLSQSSTYILKQATETGGGESIRKIVKDNNNIIINSHMYNYFEFINKLISSYNKTFILQKRINQLPWFSLFNESSVNTVRLYIYRSVIDNKIIPLHAYIRFGNKGSITDNSSQGGLTCGINKNGILNNFAITKYGEKLYNNEGVKQYKGTEVPYFFDMVNLAQSIAPLFLHHRLLGFDFSVDINGNIVLLEINNLYIGIINQQMNNGPLYGDFTEEIINYCKDKPISYCKNYYINIK